MSLSVGDNSLRLLFELCAMTLKTAMRVLQLLKVSKLGGVLEHCTADVFLLSLLHYPRTIQDLQGRVKDEGLMEL